MLTRCVLLTVAALAMETTACGTGSTNTIDSGVCASPPEGISADAAAAFQRINSTRVAMGVPCARMVAELNTAAERHCLYYASNRGSQRCIANPHAEVMDCAMFVGVSFADRVRAAGYMGSPSFEVMAFNNNGDVAVQQWIDSIWHRTPLLSPWIRDFGYGGAAGCDTMDFGVGESTTASITATYPYDGQTGVPTSFSGNEGPPPPEPPTGWPSGYPIHLYAQMTTVSTHTLQIDGTDTNIDHTWLAPGAPESMNLLRHEFVLYAHRPLRANTRYRVHIEGSGRGGAFDRQWTFTTR